MSGYAGRVAWSSDAVEPEDTELEDSGTVPVKEKRHVCMAGSKDRTNHAYGLWKLWVNWLRRIRVLVRGLSRLSGRSTF